MLHVLSMRIMALWDVRRLPFSCLQLARLARLQVSFGQRCEHTSCQLVSVLRLHYFIKVSQPFAQAEGRKLHVQAHLNHAEDKERVLRARHTLSTERIKILHKQLEQQTATCALLEVSLFLNRDLATRAGMLP